MPAAKTSSSAATLDWLLRGDPSIRWQALRDLVRAGAREVEKERRRISNEGWGAQLLALQDAEGTWARGFYNPKWTSTFYTLLLLRDLGLTPTSEPAKRACSILFNAGAQPDGGIGYGPRARSETCITGMALSLGSYFGERAERLDTVYEHLLEQQMDDGGWNCRKPRGATHSSMHTTISVLEGLKLYEEPGASGSRGSTARERILVGAPFVSFASNGARDPA